MRPRNALMFVDTDLLRSMEPLDPEVALRAVYGGFTFTQAPETEVYRIATEVGVSGRRRFRGLVDLSDFNASVDPIGHRAMRVLEKHDIVGERPELRGVRIHGNDVVFSFRVT